MREFYSARLAKHQTNMMRFLRYVFNDHFVLVGMIALGGVGYYYSEYLKTLDQSVQYMSLIVWLVWFFSLSIGKLSTLMREADAVFLLPKERQMVSYFKKSLTYSMILPAITEGLIVGVSLPLLVATSSITFSEYPWFALSLIILKWGQMWIQLGSLYLKKEKESKRSYLIWLVGAFVSIGLSIYLSVFLGLLVTVVISTISIMQTKKIIEQGQLNWEKSIRLEKNRMKRIYSFFNLFTDVPGLSNNVSRRIYLDGILNKIKKNQDNTYLYLYSRVMLRSSEYSGLIIRLTIVGAILVVFSGSYSLMALLGCLFIYLLGFQLVPMYHAFDYMIMTNLYPINQAGKKIALEKLIKFVLCIMTLLFIFLVLLSYPNKREALEISGMYLATFVAVSWVYLPYRLRKIMKK